MIFSFKRKKNVDADFYYPGQEIRLNTIERAHLEEHAKTILEASKNRVLLASAMFAVIFTSIAVRLFCVAFPSDTLLVKKNQGGYSFQKEIKRADIIDRNGVVLATNLPFVNLYCNPKNVFDFETTAKKLAATFPDLNADTILNRISDKDKTFVYIKRNITPEEQYKVIHLGLPGVLFEQGEKRVYPLGSLTSHVVGMTNIDSIGISGIEKNMDEVLLYEDVPLQLSIDIRVQEALNYILKDAVKKFKALGGGAVILDVSNGEVLGLVSLPDFDPNAITPETNYNALFNRVTSGVYEFGSIFKLFNTAMALETKTIKITDIFDASKPIRISRHSIEEDYNSLKRKLSVPEILIYSSNVGSASMALMMGAEKQKQMMINFGFSESLPIEVPEIGAPLMPKMWKDINIATMSFGYGLSITPLHVVTSAAAIFNGGMLYSPTLLKHNNYYEITGRRIVSPETSSLMNKMLRMVVDKGTGKTANVQGYMVGGKTGSAQKLVNGKYISHKLLTSFISGFPMNNPKYALFVFLDEPQPLEGARENTAALNAVPVTGEIIEAVAPLLNVEPIQEEQNDGILNVSSEYRSF